VLDEVVHARDMMAGSRGAVLSATGKPNFTGECETLYCDSKFGLI